VKREAADEAEEHDDASPDDVEPGLLLLEQPAEPSSPAGPLLPLAPPLIHPVSDRTERLVGGSLRARKALLRRAIAGSASAVEWRRGQGSASDALIYRGRSSRPLASLPWFSHITPLPGRLLAHILSSALEEACICIPLLRSGHSVSTCASGTSSDDGLGDRTVPLGACTVVALDTELIPQ
jgi:hypothetical protein